MNRRAQLLFFSTAAIWGSSYLLIRVAVRHIEPATVVFARMLLGSVFLAPLALRQSAFRGLRKHIPAIAACMVFDMAMPTFLTAWGEQHISSSLAGILTATNPLFVALLALWFVRSEAIDGRRFAGLLLGLAGVGALFGFDIKGKPEEILGSLAVIASALGYAIAALIYRRWLADVPALGATAVMVMMCSVVFAGPGIAGMASEPPAGISILAVVILGVVNTGIAYWLYYALIDAAGAASASVISYLMPVVALLLGTTLLGEKFTATVAIGLVLIAAGAWLATAANREKVSS